MKIKVSDIYKKMDSVLRAQGYPEEDIPFVINMYLGGELRGHTSHGLSSFPSFAIRQYGVDQPPSVLKATDALFMLDANSNSGNVVGRLAADEAMDRAKRQMVGMTIIKNMDGWLRPGAVAEYITNKGFVALIFSSGGEASIAPPGGYDPVIGTNPIAYGIPTNEGALVVDMATSKRAKGQIRLANKYGTDLPIDSFYNQRGEVTIDPKEAHSIKPFGEYKGFSLALLIEIMCGSMIGMPMMIEGDPSNNAFGGKTPKRGGLIIVIDPGQTTDSSLFSNNNSELIERIKKTHTRENEEIRIPGEQAAHQQSIKQKNDYLVIPDELWDEIQKL